MVTFPDELAIKVLANHTPLAGAGVNITATTTKNGLPLLCPLVTDEHGELHLSKADLDGWAAAARSTGLMDYGPLTGELLVTAVTLTDVARRRGGYELWDPSSFPAGYLGWLGAVEATLTALPASTVLGVVVGARGGTSIVKGSQVTR